MADVMMIGPITVDVYLSETYSLASEVTRYPIEDGSTISDNISASPKGLKVEGFISDAPLGTGLEALRQRETGGTLAPSEFCYTQLEKIHSDQLPVTVATSLRTYASMAMVSCDVSRDKDTGRALSFSASFEEITIVTNRRTVVRTELHGAKSVNRGFKAVATQSFANDDGQQETRVVYKKTSSTGQVTYTYADGTPLQHRNAQTLQKLKDGATPVTLDKNSAYKTRPDQVRTSGKPYGPYIGGGKT